MSEPEISSGGAVSQEQNKISGSSPRPVHILTRYAIAFVACVVVVASIIGIKLTTQEQKPLGESYTLVDEKVSESAAITVTLPEDIPLVEFDPSQSITFTPEIPGRWESLPQNSGEHKTFRYLPKQKLTLGTYYRARLETKEISLEKMFSVDHDPAVIAVFPKSETEVNEYSKITVMFNRPMVSLSTLSENADMEVPITITPPTEGRFKWITTRTLQFIPASRLTRSAHYTVAINDGFRSLDGVAVAPFTHKFITTSLRQKNGWDSLEVLTHNQPIRIFFTQPINLEETRSLITLVGPSGTPRTFVAAYGTREMYDQKTKKSRALMDRSILEVFPEQDIHGRKYLWDFNTSFRLTLRGAVPLEGDVRFTDTIEKNIKIEEIISSLGATSPRSELVSPDVFDPTGTLVFSMSEPIDLKRSSISGKGIAAITYGEMCKEPAPGTEVSMDLHSCEKTRNQKELVVSFDPEQFTLGERSSIIFHKLVNIDGLVLASSPIERPFTTYKKFSIARTTPQEGEKNADLTELKLCSTNPLSKPADNEFYQKIRSNMMIGKWNWNDSYYIALDSPPEPGQCPQGTYETVVRYGLVPNFAYELTLDLVDHFGQTLQLPLHFTTRDADPLSKGFSHLQSTDLMASPERTTLTYALDYMDEIDLTVCKVSAETMLQYRLFRLPITTGAESLPCIESMKKHIALPKSPATRKYFQIDIREFYDDPIGNFVLVFSNPGYRQVIPSWRPSGTIYDLGEQLFEKTYLNVTRLAVVAKQLERREPEWIDPQTKSLRRTFMNDAWPGNLYWVNDVNTLLPVSDSIVTPFNAKYNLLARQTPHTTNTDGIAETPSADNIVGAVITKGSDAAVIAETTDAFTYVPPANPTRREFIYTDRPIYRPGDEVYIKGIARIGYDASYERASGSTTIEIRDARYETARKQEVLLNGSGTFEASFTLDAKAPLGYYQITTDSGGYGSFQVEEYVAPQFQVDVATNKDEYISKDTATINVSANYYFGVPVDKGEVTYRIVSQEYYFDRYQDEYFSFGQSWYESDHGWYGDRFITSGKIALGPDGRGTITQPLDIDTMWKDDYRSQSKILTIHVTVKNTNGQSVSTQHSFILHRGDFYVGMTGDRYFYPANEQGVMRVKTVDIKGSPIEKNDLKYVLNKIEWKSYKRQEVDGNFYYRTERTKKKVLEGTVDTDQEGNGSFTFTANEAGEYQFTISGTDRFDNVVEAQYDLYVSGSESVEVRPTNNETLELRADRTELQVGDTARFVIVSPYPKAKALVTIARGRIFERKVLDITSQISEFSYLVTEEYAPNVTAEVLLLAPGPEVKFGSIDYRIGTKEKELTVTIMPNKRVYLPGEEVALDIRVTDSSGRPVQAELSLSVVDLSVLALVGNPKKNPVSFFYNGEPLTIRTFANVKNVLHVMEIPVGTKGGAGGGGEDLAKKQRGVFRDTAHWSGTLETDQKGRASVRFSLPDNLTKWQVESVGVTRDSKIGAGYEDFVSRKSLMAVPLKPRFVLPGDNFEIGGTIFNETDEVQRVNVVVSSLTLELLGKTNTSVVIDPHTSLSVAFPVRAPETHTSGMHEFTLSAKNATYEDTVSSKFPVERNETFEFTASAARVADQNWSEQIYIPKEVLGDRGGLSLSVSATMATILDSAIQHLIVYPYECSEQIASKLRTIALIKTQADLFGTSSSRFPNTATIGDRTYTMDEVITMGLAKLYENENADGGISFYSHSEPSYWATLSALRAYIALQNAGYKIDKQKLDLAARYVSYAIMYPRADRMLSEESIIEGAYILSKTKKDAILEEAIIKKIRSYAGNADMIHRRLSTPAVAHLAALSVSSKLDASLKSRLFAELENRSVVDARGTTVRSIAGSETSFYENHVYNTALALKAFSEAKRDSPLIEGYLRAIKNTKGRDGGWASTYNSITVIDAMSSYLSWKRELDARFSLAATLDDGSPLITVAFDRSNILDTYATTVPMSLLKKDAPRSINFQKKDAGKTGQAYYYDMLLRYFLPTHMIGARDEGLAIERNYYRLDDTELAHPVEEATQGEVLRARVTIKTPSARSHVTIEDFIPAGVEIVNQRFATEDQTLEMTNDTEMDSSNEFSGSVLREDNHGGLANWLAQTFSFGRSVIGPKTSTNGEVSDNIYSGKDVRERRLYPTAVENHDDRVFAYIDSLEEGEYFYEYYIRALVPGIYQHLPAVATELYTPENFGRTEGSVFTVHRD